MPLYFALSISSTEVAEFGLSTTYLTDMYLVVTNYIPANSARRFNLQFMFHDQALPPDKKAFDKIILTYFYEKNNIHAFHFVEANQCWIEGSLRIEKQ